MKKEINTEERPHLTINISVEDFGKFYWLKEELIDFCREYSIKSSGGKIEISKRISYFLKTGLRASDALIFGAGEPRSTIKRPSSSSYNSNAEFSLDTIITPNFKCSQKLREFLKSNIGPQFHFSTNFQNFLKANPGKKLNDAIGEWHREQEEKKIGNFKTKIAPQFEYNAYIRSFFDDPQNKGKSLREAIDCWKYKRSLPGHNKYERTDFDKL
jgi:hypothetical protein